jgi:hypothetical protein
VDHIQNLKNIIRNLSVSRLSLTTPVPGLRLEEATAPQDLVHGAMMSVVLVAGGAFRLAFKAHFSSRSVRHLMSTTLGINGSQISETQLKDYMREYSNLVAGGIKATFSSYGIASGISLPLVTDGFDEVLYTASQKMAVVQDLWELSWSGGSVVCGSSIEVLDREQFSKLPLKAEMSNTETTSDEDAFL